MRAECFVTHPLRLQSVSVRDRNSRDAKDGAPTVWLGSSKEEYGHSRGNSLRRHGPARHILGVFRLALAPAVARARSGLGRVKWVAFRAAFTLLTLYNVLEYTHYSRLLMMITTWTPIKTRIAHIDVE